MATSTNGFFWDSVDHDRIYDAGSFENWLKRFFTSGVFNGELKTTQSDALVVTVSKGYCNIDGKVQMFTGDTQLTISPGNATYPRIDNIVVERNNLTRDISIKVVAGSATSSTASAPARIWSDTLKQLVVAQVTVPAGATSITQANIKDTRNTSLCGIVAGTVKEIDFTQMQAQFDAYYKQFTETTTQDFDTWSSEQRALYEQYESEMQTAFNEWFLNIQTTLSGDTAGNLQNQITEVDDQITEVDDRLTLLQYMTTHNDYFAPLLDDDGNTVVDDNGNAVMVDWQYVIK